MEGDTEGQREPETKRERQRQRSVTCCQWSNHFGEPQLNTPCPRTQPFHSQVHKHPGAIGRVSAKRHIQECLTAPVLKQPRCLSAVNGEAQPEHSHHGCYRALERERAADLPSHTDESHRR